MNKQELIFNKWKDIHYDIEEVAAFCQNDWEDFPVSYEDIELFSLKIKNLIHKIDILGNQTLILYENIITNGKQSRTETSM